MATSGNDVQLPSYASKLHGRRVLVFGGTSGIGFAVACAAYEAGAQVIVSSSSPDKVARTVQRIREGYPTVPASSSISGEVSDLGNPGTVEDNLKALFEAATAGGPLDHIAYCTGGGPEIKPLTEASIERIHGTGHLHVVVPILIAKVILQRQELVTSGGHGSSAPYLKWSPDSSITLTSGSANLKAPTPGWAIVSAYSAGVEGLARALAKDLPPVRVNAISPGIVETEMLTGLFAGMPEEMKNGVYGGMTKETVTGRLGRPQDLAEAYLYCMRDGFVAGSVLATNGGRVVV